MHCYSSSPVESLKCLACQFEGLFLKERKFIFLLKDHLLINVTEPC